MLKIVSHIRTGTHYLCSLLHRNLETGAADYEELHYSHSRLPPNGEKYIHIHRPLFSVLLSVWRIREHAGLHGSVSFSDLVHTPHSDLPRTSSCEAVFNGERWDRVCPPKGYLPEETFPEHWLRMMRLFDASAHASYSYDLAVNCPLHVVEDVSQKFGVAKVPGFAPVLSRVGWWPAKQETPEVTEQDMRRIEAIQAQWCDLRSHPPGSLAYPPVERG